MHFYDHLLRFLLLIYTCHHRTIGMNQKAKTVIKKNGEKPKRHGVQIYSFL